jgi:hypothetical protein
MELEVVVSSEMSEETYFMVYNGKIWLTWTTFVAGLVHLNAATDVRGRKVSKHLGAPQNSRRRKNDTGQVPFWRRTNIGRHRQVARELCPHEYTIVLSVWSRRLPKYE